MFSNKFSKIKLVWYHFSQLNLLNLKITHVFKSQILILLFLQFKNCLATIFEIFIKIMLFRQKQF